MTKKEAIKTINEILENSYLSIGECKLFEVEKEAMKVAVEALEQPEIIRCKDCCFYAISKEKRSWCKDMLRRIQPEDFCSHAKMREEQ